MAELTTAKVPRSRPAVAAHGDRDGAVDVQLARHPSRSHGNLARRGGLAADLCGALQQGFVTAAEMQSRGVARYVIRPADQLTRWDIGPMWVASPPLQGPGRTGAPSPLGAGPEPDLDDEGL